MPIGSGMSSPTPQQYPNPGRSCLGKRSRRRLRGARSQTERGNSEPLRRSPNVQRVGAAAIVSLAACLPYGATASLHARAAHAVVIGWIA